MAPRRLSSCSRPGLQREAASLRAWAAVEAAVRLLTEDRDGLSIGRPTPLFRSSKAGCCEWSDFHRERLQFPGPSPGPPQRTSPWIHPARLRQDGSGSTDQDGEASGIRGDDVESCSHVLSFSPLRRGGVWVNEALRPQLFPQFCGYGVGRHPEVLLDLLDGARARYGCGNGRVRQAELQGSRL